MPNLYELMGDFEALQSAMDNEGVSDEELTTLLDAVDEAKGSLRDKLDNICRLLRNVDGDVDKFKNEERRIGARRKAMENKKERVREWVKSTMDVLAVDKMKTDIFEVSIVAGAERVIVVDEEKVPEEYLRVKTTVDIAKVKQAYKQDGEIVPGCDIVAVPSLRIR
jgi:hypothetical protein